MKSNVYIYILIMAGVTYIIRLLPLLLVRNEIENVTVKSFLYYVPYVTLSVMTRHTERDKQRCICGGRFYNGSIDCVQRRQSF